MVSKKRKILLVVCLFVCTGVVGLYLYFQKPEPTNDSFILNHFKMKGYTLLQQRKKEEALKYLQKASELDPKDQKLKNLVKQLESN